MIAFALAVGAQEVNGIYTDSTTKDLGDITKVDALKGIKFRGWVEGYNVVNFNRLNKDVANANQGSSAVQSRDLTIEGRTFDVHSSVGATPSSKFNLYANYLGGPERPNNNADWRHLGDFQVLVAPSANLQMFFNIDYGVDKNALGPGLNAKWQGYTFYIRPNVKDRFFPTGRVEYYDDRDGFTTGKPGHLWGLTGGYETGRKGRFRPSVVSSRDSLRSCEHQLLRWRI